MALSRATALNVSILTAAFKFLGGISGLVNSSDTARQGAGLPAPSLKFLRSRAAAPTVAEQAWLKDPQHHLVPFTDPRYPHSLHELPSSPIALYVAGNAAVLNDPQLSIVGSRNPTP